MPAWSGPQHQRMSIEIPDYQVPDALDGQEANWLTVSVVVTTPDLSWERAAPALFTWELIALARWLEMAVIGLAMEDRFIAQEHDFELVYIGRTVDGHRFAACLRHALLPPGAGDTRYARIVDLHLSDDEVLEAQEWLEDTRSRLPPRGEMGPAEEAKQLGGSVEF